MGAALTATAFDRLFDPLSVRCTVQAVMNGTSAAHTKVPVKIRRMKPPSRSIGYE
jgi:hypothetical protein